MNKEIVGKKKVVEDVKLERSKKTERILEQPKWQPKKGDKYYIPCLFKDEMYDTYCWSRSILNSFHYFYDQIFKTKEEAIEATNKIIQKLKEA